MRIDQWPMERMMQLPDWVFGRRYAVCCMCRGPTGATEWDISELAFPNVGVIWEVQICTAYWSYQGDYVRVALGEQLPTVAAEMSRLEPLVPGLGHQGAEPREINLYQYQAPWAIPMRQPMQFQGRKLVIEVRTSATKDAWVHVVVVVSSMPKEVPDWLRW